MLIIPEAIKELFKQNSAHQNVRIHFLNGEREDITEKNLTSESFSFSESICSRHELKFGLCEASVVEFECVGIENIKGYGIEVFHEIDISSLPEEFIAEYGTVTDDVAFPYYSIPYGRFIVEECPKSTKDMDIRKVTAYGITTEGMTALTPLEVAKRKFGCGSNIPYKIDAEKYMYSSLRGDFRIEGAEYNALSLVEYTAGEYGKDYTITYKTYSVTDEGKEQDLYYLSFKEQYTLKRVNETVLNWVSENLPDRVDEYADTISNLSLYKIYPHLSIFYEEAWHNTLLINQHYFCPYLSSDLEYYMDNDGVNPTRRICVPITFNIYDSTSGERIATIPLYDESEPSVSRVILPDDYDADPIWLEIPRVKKKINGVSCYVVEENIHYPVEVAKGLLELKGLFGLYRRNNYPEMVSMKGKFGLYPSESLLPSPLLHFSQANAGSYGAAYYQSAWFDDYSILPYGLVKGTYTNMDGEAVDIEYQIPKAIPTINDVLVLEQEVSSKYVYFEYLGQTITVDDAQELMVVCPYPIASVEVITESSAGTIYGWNLEIEEGADAFILNEDILGVSLDSLRHIYITLEEQEEYSGTAYLEKYDYDDPVYYSEGEYATYDMSDNYILKNAQISESNLMSRLNEFEDNVKDIMYTPAEVDLIGMPWIEAGDVVEIVGKDFAFETIVMNRTLKGIQALKDSYESV